MLLEPSLTMKNILETTQLEFDKSNFLIDIVKHDSGRLYIEINQTIGSEFASNRTIKINPVLLTGIITVLIDYQSKLQNDPAFTGHISDSDQLKMQNRYLKGVKIEDLSLQFDLGPNQIKQILKNRGIPIVSQDAPKKYWKKKKFRKR